MYSGLGAGLVTLAADFVISLFLKLLLVSRALDGIAECVEEFIHIKIGRFLPGYALSLAHCINQDKGVPLCVESSF